VGGERGRVRVLDVGCGVKPYYPFFAEHAAEYVGLDVVPNPAAELLGPVEALPVEDGTVDVVISNCVLNLVPDKAKAFAETFRVLRAGGHFCVSDIVATSELPEGIRKAAALYVGCVAGAIPETDYLAVIRAAGFGEVRIAERKPIALPDAILAEHLAPAELAAFRASGIQILSVTVVGSKPAACCGADCCS